MISNIDFTVFILALGKGCFCLPCFSEALQIGKNTCERIVSKEGLKWSVLESSQFKKIAEYVFEMLFMAVTVYPKSDISIVDIAISS